MLKKKTEYSRKKTVFKYQFRYIDNVNVYEQEYYSNIHFVAFFNFYAFASISIPYRIPVDRYTGKKKSRERTMYSSEKGVKGIEYIHY